MKYPAHWESCPYCLLFQKYICESQTTKGARGAEKRAKLCWVKLPALMGTRPSNQNSTETQSCSLFASTGGSPLHGFFNVRALSFKWREILCKAYCCDCSHLKMCKLALLGHWMDLTSLGLCQRKHAHCFVGIHDHRDCVRAQILCRAPYSPQSYLPALSSEGRIP